jgi:hypothetical protein
MTTSVFHQSGRLSGKWVILAALLAGTVGCVNEADHSEQNMTPGGEAGYIAEMRSLGYELPPGYELERFVRAAHTTCQVLVLQP